VPYFVDLTRTGPVLPPGTATFFLRWNFSTCLTVSIPIDSV